MSTHKETFCHTEKLVNSHSMRFSFFYFKKNRRSKKIGKPRQQNISLTADESSLREHVEVWLRRDNNIYIFCYART